MAKGDGFWTSVRKRNVLKEAEGRGEVADSMEVRTQLMRRVEAGEITLPEAQEELKKIKSRARKEGKKTRSQCWRDG